MFPPETAAFTNLRPRAVNMAASENVIVAVKAEKVISNSALAWALSHVVLPGDCITLLAVFSAEKTGRRLWSFPRLTGECRSTDPKKLPDRMSQISESCSQMVLQFHDQVQVKVQIKVVSGTSAGAVAAEAKSNTVNWVILDKNLKRELKHCMEELHCNIVVMKGSHPKVLRLNLGYQNEQKTSFSASSSPGLDSEKLQGHGMMHCTPVSSPEEPCSSYSKTSGKSSLSSLETGTSLFLVYEQNPLFEGLNKGMYMPSTTGNDLADPLNKMGLGGEGMLSLSTAPKASITRTHRRVLWIPQNHIINMKAIGSKNNGNTKSRSSDARTELGNSVQYNQDMRVGGSECSQAQGRDYIFNSNIRDVVSLGRSSSIPPPLCSLCQYKAPAFGKPPRQFHYNEIEEATDGFSETNFLAEGGFGLVHRGVLRDGLVVAVKQLKFAGSQGDADFCREVQVLSCAQHRNVVLLIGFCIEDKKRVLVYEFVCNASLDFHLHGKKTTPLDWHERLKIAIGTARGLRYLHEDCRVGCILHRDMRPKNILLTHNYEPMVADFGLARLHSEGGISDHDRIVGTSGYLAPEYIDGGKITEKVDIYAFGLILLELITGRKTSELPCYRRQHFFSEYFYPFSALDPIHVLACKHQLLDPCFASYQLQNLPLELQAMGCAASLCLQRDPDSRPPMSKVLRILEGGNTVIPLALDLNSAGNRSGHMQGLTPKRTT